LLEGWSATGFLVGGVIFVADLALLATHATSGTDPGAFAQAFVGAAWTAAFVGLLGLYPTLAARSRWLARVGAVFAVVGGVTMAAMAATSLGYSTGILGGRFSAVVAYFLPGVFAGIVLGFGSFAVTSLRTGVYSRGVGLLFFVLPLTFLFNLATGAAGVGSIATIISVVCVLAASMLATGYLLRTGSALGEQDGLRASSDASAD
jgi:hypothetical protein